MKPTAVLILIISIMVSGEKRGVSQQEDASSALSAGQKAVSVVTKHYILNPLALNPATKQPLPRDGSWSIAKTTPKSCPQSTQPCVEVVYSVPTVSVQCSWVVLLNADGKDGVILEQNGEADRYLLRKLSQNEARPLVQLRTKPVYPAIALAAHVTGSVVMDAVVDENGHMQRVVILSGPEMLRATSLDAARKWTFTPSTVSTKAVPFEVQLKFDFNTFGPPVGTVGLSP